MYVWLYLRICKTILYLALLMAEKTNFSLRVLSCETIKNYDLQENNVDTNFSLKVM